MCHIDLRRKHKYYNRSANDSLFMVMSMFYNKVCHETHLSQICNHCPAVGLVIIVIPFAESGIIIKITMYF